MHQHEVTDELVQGVCIVCHKSEMCMWMAQNCREHIGHLHMVGLDCLHEYLEAGQGTVAPTINQDKIFTSDLYRLIGIECRN